MAKKGISPIIAIILLLMMTVAVAGAAFFWLTRIQNELQGGTSAATTRTFTQLATSIDVIDADYNLVSATQENLSIFFHNTGNTKIPVRDADTSPTTSWILRDSNQVAICSTLWNGTPGPACEFGCGANVQIEPGQIHRVILDLDGSNCELQSFSNGTVFSFTIDFGGVATPSGSFIKE